MLPKRRADLSFRDVDGETVVLDRRLGKVHQLNRTASYVWQHCDGRTEVRQIVASLARSYGVEPGDVAADVAAVMAQFAELGLIETQAAGASGRSEPGIPGSEGSS
jgi:PqqD family protein of HPr-rel-A system